MRWLKKTPAWVLVICVALAAIEPVTHAALAAIENEDAVFSGLHHSDSAIFLACMRMLDNGFFSPYATCLAPNGPMDAAFLPTPFHWLYAIVGAAGKLTGIDPFLFLGLANGLSGFIYLLCVYTFLRAAAPRLANTAFLLFALGGGLGGMAWWLSHIGGLHDAARFERYFYRFLMYELLEGPGLLPVLHMPRLYYTASLAFSFGALTALIEARRTGCGRHAKFAGFLLLCATLINVRHGGFAWAIAAIYLTCQDGEPFRERLAACAKFFIPVALGIGVFYGMTLFSPVLVGTSLAIVRQDMWPTAFISVAIFHLALLAWLLPKYLPRFALFQRCAAFAALGYLGLLATLFVGHMVYYGNYWKAGDSSALVLFSDFALLGGAAGAVYGWASRRAVSDKPEALDWIVLWALAFMVLGMSAFGQGWGLQLVPQRLMLFLGVPLSIVSAAALDRIRANAPRAAHAIVGVFVACGLASIAAGSLYIQAPLGNRPGEGAYAWLHPEIISPADATLLERLEAGIVLAPKRFSDVIAMRPDMRVLGGIGATDLSDRPSTELDEVSARFFGAADEAEREAAVQQWCIDYVYCPQTWPVADEVLAQLEGYSWLETVARSGHGRVFRVAPE